MNLFMLSRPHDARTLVALSFVACAFGQTNSPLPQKNNEIVGRLRPNTGIEKVVLGGERHSYLIHLERGQHMRALVTQFGISVIVRAFDPSGKETAKVHSTDTPGRESIVLVAKLQGDYRLEVIVESGEGRYQIVTLPTPFPPATADSSPSPPAYPARDSAVLEIPPPASRLAVPMPSQPADAELNAAIRHRTPPAFRGAREISHPPKLLMATYGVLEKGSVEKSGYGLYSYILFGSRPNDSANSARRQRYMAAIDALLRMEPIEAAVLVASPTELNVVFLPVLEPPVRWDDATCQVAKTLGIPYKIVECRYDYARSQKFLSVLNGSHLDGPYIISTMVPLSSLDTLPEHYLYQDLSSVPSRMVSMWVREFISQAQQPKFWETRTKEQFVLSLRTVIAIGAEELPNLEALISWTLGPTTIK